MNIFTRMRLILVAALLGVLAAIFTPTVSFAADAPVIVEDVGHSYVLSPTMWKFIIGLALPFVIGLLSKVNGNDTVKAVLGIVIAAVSAAAIRATQVDGSAVFDQALFEDIFMVYGVQLLSYLGVYRYVGGRENGGINQYLAPNAGLG